MTPKGVHGESEIEGIYDPVLNSIENDFHPAAASLPKITWRRCFFQENLQCTEWIIFIMRNEKKRPLRKDTSSDWSINAKMRLYENRIEADAASRIFCRFCRVSLSLIRTFPRVLMPLNGWNLITERILRQSGDLPKYTDETPIYYSQRFAKKLGGILQYQYFHHWFDCQRWKMTSSITSMTSAKRDGSIDFYEKLHITPLESEFWECGWGN